MQISPLRLPVVDEPVASLPPCPALPCTQQLTNSMLVSAVSSTFAGNLFSATFPLPSGALGSVPGSSLPQQYFYPCEPDGQGVQPASLALEQMKLENKMVQREVLILVDELCGSPLCETMMARMKRLLKKLRSLMLVIKRLGSCNMLRIKATEAAVESGLLQQKITYPFLYTALLHKAFKQYPAGPSGQVRGRRARFYEGTKA